MHSPLNRYILLAKRWLWVIILGVVLCSVGAYAVSKLMHPRYQASAFLVLTMGSSATAPYESTSASLAALQTYATLLTNHVVLDPVAAQHKGLTEEQLSGMISVKPQSNTQIIELDVTSTDPQLATQLANEVGQSFAYYVNTHLPPAAVQVLPAQVPTAPASPKPSTNALLGALVGLGLALALIVIFEWLDDRPKSPEEVQELLGLDPLTIIPKLSKRESREIAGEASTLAEQCRILCARLNAAQAMKPFIKGVMITSAFTGEGKTTVAANLASLLAMAGKRVLLVDANLRRPMLHHYFQLENQRGLTSVFTESWMQLEQELNDQPTDTPTLRVLTAGETPFNPAEQLQSSLAHQLFSYLQKMPQFDYVIFDTPALLPVADSQILASYIQTTVLVIDAAKTPRKALVRARQLLNKTRTTTLGMVLNRSNWLDLGELRQYLSETQQIQTSSSLPMPLAPPRTPPLESEDISIPDTHPLSDGANPDVTVTVTRKQKDSGEKA